MGFTQKASCRPYKNCYKSGGARTTRKKKSGNMFYHSSHVSMTSHPAEGEPFGKKTEVTIKNGKGTKRMATLSKTGKVTKVNEKPLKKTEVNEIVKGNYVPGLWVGV
jgi:hypothetical protein